LKTLAGKTLSSSNLGVSAATHHFHVIECEIAGRRGIRAACPVATPASVS
jgi:hypothetical protein